MTNLRKLAATLTVSLAVFIAIPAMAFDRMVAVDPRTFHDNVGRSLVTLHDPIERRPVEVDFHDKTLGNIRPGDVVHLDGEPHTVTSVAHEMANASRLEGLGFAIAAFIKFHAHKDNPFRPGG